MESLEARYLFAAGDLDKRYSGDGLNQFTINNASDIHVAAALVDPSDGSTLVVADAQSTVSGTRDLLVARVTSSGDLDPGFGPGHQGYILFDATGAPGVSGRQDYATSVALDPRDRQIVIAGYTTNAVAGSPGEQDDVLVTRLLSDGTPDLNFGGSGTALLGLVRPDLKEASDRANAVLVEKRGAILIAGRSDFLSSEGKGAFNLARFLPMAPLIRRSAARRLA